jgi:hypothetical protein
MGAGNEKQKLIFGEVITDKPLTCRYIGSALRERNVVLERDDDKNHREQKSYVNAGTIL